MKIRIQVGQLYITRRMLSSVNPYVSIRSGTSKVKTKSVNGENANFGETLFLENDNTKLTVKVKDAKFPSWLNCSCAPLNSLISSTQIDISRCFSTMETIEGYYSLTFDGAPAGKIYLVITPLSQ